MASRIESARRLFDGSSPWLLTAAMFGVAGFLAGRRQRRLAAATAVAAARRYLQSPGAGRARRVRGRDHRFR